MGPLTNLGWPFVGIRPDTYLVGQTDGFWHYLSRQMYYVSLTCSTWSYGTLDIWMTSVSSDPPCLGGNLSFLWPIPSAPRALLLLHHLHISSCIYDLSSSPVSPRDMYPWPSSQSSTYTSTGPWSWTRDYFILCT
jgi:hypothetical protein